MSSALVNARGSGPSGPPSLHRNLRGAPGRLTRRGETHEESGFAPFKVRADRGAGRVEDLEAALVRYCATTTGDVVVDGSDLRFLDRTVLRILVELEVRLRPLGRRLVLHGFGVRGPEEFERGGFWLSRGLDGGPNRSRGLPRDSPVGSPPGQ